MTHPALRPLRPLAALLVLGATVVLSGCFNPFSPRIAPGLGTSKPAPVPSSASGVLRLFEWCYNNRAIAEYREIFTDDYRFFFSPLDSAGAEYRGTPWTREDELISATQLFEGGSAAQPPASSIRLILDRSFVISPDFYHAQWDPTGRWHKNIRTQVVLNIQTADGSAIDITGGANFYLVRGDSALIPEELRLRGFGPDSNRWYIRRWDDETAQPDLGPLAARRAADAARRTAAWGPVAAPRPGRGPRAVQQGQPFVRASWGSVKAFYRRPPPAQAARAAPGTPPRP